MQRIIMIAGGGVVLLLLIVLVVSLFSSAGSAQKQDWFNLLQQQTELIRVSEVGMQKAHSSEAKNLATTTKLSLESSIPSLSNLANKAGADVSAKKLAGGRNAQTDSTLEQAEQANNFDQVFISTLVEELDNYKQTLKKLYDASGNSKTKSELQTTYQTVTILIDSYSKDGDS